MRRWAPLAAGLVALQLGLLAVYVATSPADPDPAFAWEPLDEPAPAALPVGDGVVIVHFWATWCAPCRTELPELLAVADEEGARVVAATDEAPEVVARHFGGAVPAAIVGDPGGDGRAAYEVSGLPDTFLVRDGRVVARVGGPRPWGTAAGRRFLRGDP